MSSAAMPAPVQALAQVQAWMAAAFSQPQAHVGAIREVPGALTAIMRSAQAAAVLADAQRPMETSREGVADPGELLAGQREPLSVAESEELLVGQRDPSPHPNKPRCGEPSLTAESLK